MAALASRLALACPGQGAQRLGMGVDVAAAYPAAAEVFRRAGAVLDLDLLAICRDGPASELGRTDLQQPAIRTVGAAVIAALRAGGALPQSRLVAAFGLSLGEFTALTAAGVLALEDAVALVRERGLGMQEASERVRSGMTALAVERDVAEALCAAARAATGGVCSVANLNAPGQVVISGDLDSLDKAEALAKEQGVRRPTRLPVAGAFHSTLMQPGAERLAKALARVKLAAPSLPVIPNATARPTRDVGEIRAALLAQVTSPVRFVECVEAARALGAEGLLEPAPGTVLASLVRRIDPALVMYGAPTSEAVAELLAAVPVGERTP
jgi:[acyl-carrier-protein] S-malonyltransferase